MRRDRPPEAEAFALSARILDGHALAGRILDEARALARAVQKRRGRPPRLAIIAADDAAAQSYLKAKLRACSQAGVDAFVLSFSRLATIVDDPAVDAVLAETPYPAGLSAARVASLIPPGKDVEGLNPISYGRLFLAKSWPEAKNLIAPCTAAAVARLALFAKVPLAGRRAVVIGRSAVVGHPAAHLLSTLNLTVTTAHHLTKNIAALGRKSDVIVAAAGVPSLVKPSWIKPGALLIDVGITRVKGHLVGDISPACARRAGALTPVPGGVGPVTTAIAVLQAARLAAAAL